MRQTCRTHLIKTETKLQPSLTALRNSVNWRVGVGEAAGNGRLEGQIVARANEKGLEAFSQCRFGPKSEGAASERKQILVISERETGGGQEDGS